MARHPRTGRPAARAAAGSRRSRRLGSTSRRRRSCGGRTWCSCCGRDRASRRAGTHSTATPRRRRRSTAPSPSVTGARVVVDSSRLPIEPVALGLVPGVDVRVAQVVRDPRAVVYSWKRSKITTDRDTGEYMPKFSASYSTTSWLGAQPRRGGDPSTGSGRGRPVRRDRHGIPLQYCADSPISSANRPARWSSSRRRPRRSHRPTRWAATRYE